MNTTLEILNKVTWLVDLDRSHHSLLAGIASVSTINAGEKVFAEGDISNNLYIVVDGKVDVKIFVPKHGYVTVFTAKPYDLIGWASMTSVVKINAGYAVALQPTKFLTFQGSELKKICDENPVIGYTIMRRLANVIAGRLISTRLHLFEIILKSETQT